MKENELEWTGERLVTSIQNYGAIEHLHRYSFASEFVDNKIVADIACGEGYGTSILSKKAKMVYGIDISKETIVHANNKYQRRNLIFIEGSVDNTSLERSTIDVLVSFETLEHIINQDAMLLECKRILREEGILIISSPERSNYQDKQLGKNQFHLKELYYSEFKNLIEKYFSNVLYFKQKFVSGSFIIPFKNSIGFKLYNGDFYKINESYSFDDQTFNICIASNKSIDYQICSLFDLGTFQINNSTDQVKKSNSTFFSKKIKLNKIIYTPYRIIKKIFK